MDEKNFIREERYIVVKLKDLHCADANVSAMHEKALRDFLAENDIPTRECVVVESDWPEYETVWQMIEARVTGKTRTLSRNDVLEEAAQLVDLLALGYPASAEVTDVASGLGAAAKAMAEIAAAAIRDRKDQTDG